MRIIFEFKRLCSATIQLKYTNQTSTELDEFSVCVLRSPNRFKIIMKFSFITFSLHRMHMFLALFFLCQFCLVIFILTCAIPRIVHVNSKQCFTLRGSVWFMWIYIYYRHRIYPNAHSLQDSPRMCALFTLYNRVWSSANAFLHLSCDNLPSRSERLFSAPRIDNKMWRCRVQDMQSQNHTKK